MKHFLIITVLAAGMLCGCRPSATVEIMYSTGLVKAEAYPAVISEAEDLLDEMTGGHRRQFLISGSSVVECNEKALEEWQELVDMLDMDRLEGLDGSFTYAITGLDGDVLGSIDFGYRYF